MELDQEKQDREAAERSRVLAQRIVRELCPRSIQVLGGSGLLEKALDKMDIALVEENAALLVVVDAQWVQLPAVQAEKVLLVCEEYTAMAACAKQLAEQGLYRDFAWQDRSHAQMTALFGRTAVARQPELLVDYEQQLDTLRERAQQAECTAAAQAAQLERPMLISGASGWLAACRTSSSALAKRSARRVLPGKSFLYSRLAFACARTPEMPTRCSVAKNTNSGKVCHSWRHLLTR